jgi:hypothetical protein
VRVRWSSVRIERVFKGGGGFDCAATRRAELGCCLETRLPLRLNLNVAWHPSPFLRHHGPLLARIHLFSSCSRSLVTQISRRSRRSSSPFPFVHSFVLARAGPSVPYAHGRRAAGCCHSIDGIPSEEASIRHREYDGDQEEEGRRGRRPPMDVELASRRGERPLSPVGREGADGGFQVPQVVVRRCWDAGRGRWDESRRLG